MEQVLEYFNYLFSGSLQFEYNSDVTWQMAAVSTLWRKCRVSDSPASCIPYALAGLRWLIDIPVLKLLSVVADAFDGMWWKMQNLKK